MSIVDSAPHQRHPRRRPATKASGGFIVAKEPLSLSRISQRDVTAVVIRRNPDALAALANTCPDVGFCRMTGLGSGFRAHALVGKSFSSEVSDVLTHDLERVHAWLRRVDARRGHAQLYVVATDECRKFHVDYYRLRLLVTYVGPGTELAPEHVLHRGALGTGGDDFEAANRDIVLDGRKVVRARPCDLVLLKGAQFGHGLAAVHRSPPLGVSCGRRLVLKLTVE